MDGVTLAELRYQLVAAVGRTRLARTIIAEAVSGTPLTSSVRWGTHTTTSHAARAVRWAKKTFKADVDELLRERD